MPPFQILIRPREQNEVASSEIGQVSGWGVTQLPFCFVADVAGVQTESKAALDSTSVEGF